MDPNAPNPNPKASRPKIQGVQVPPAAEGLLPWEWARERLEKSHNYWLSTVGREGAPHTMPVWGVWAGAAWYFSTGAESRKGRNLANNPRCVVCNDSAEEAVILEGVARRVPDSEVPLQVLADYKTKYEWEIQGTVFEVRPRKVFAIPEEEFPAGVTRWIFD
jgi:nitroimidazol reductase NimA-like FMN-containing flavoprotein (pyridoxamine 5'-phosphate oxidase superfamily)